MPPYDFRVPSPVFPGTALKEHSSCRAATEISASGSARQLIKHAAIIPVATTDQFSRWIHQPALGSRTAKCHAQHERVTVWPVVMRACVPAVIVKCNLPWQIRMYVGNVNYPGRPDVHSELLAERSNQPRQANRRSKSRQLIHPRRKKSANFRIGKVTRHEADARIARTSSFRADNCPSHSSTSACVLLNRC
jgi:hypothetical protein